MKSKGMKTNLIMMAGLLCATSVSSQAAIILNIKNHSFEAVGTSAGADVPTDWIFSIGQESSTVVNPVSPDPKHLDGPLDGSRYLALSPSTRSSVIYDDSGFSDEAELEIGTYTITVSATQRPEATPGTFRAALVGVDEFGGNDAIITSPNVNPTKDSVLADYVFTYEITAANAADYLGNAFHIGITSNASVETDIDNVRLEFTPVPEPSAALLGGLGLLALLRRRR